MQASQQDTREGLAQDFSQAGKPDLPQSRAGPAPRSSPVLPPPAPGCSQEAGQTGVLATGPELHLLLWATCFISPVIFSLLTFILILFGAAECTFLAESVLSGTKWGLRCSPLTGGTSACLSLDPLTRVPTTSPFKQGEFNFPYEITVKHGKSKNTLSHHNMEKTFFYLLPVSDGHPPVSSTKSIYPCPPPPPTPGRGPARTRPPGRASQLYPLTPGR